jgi:hypothetical protein
VHARRRDIVRLMLEADAGCGERAIGFLPKAQHDQRRLEFVAKRRHRFYFDADRIAVGIEVDRHRSGRDAQVSRDLREAVADRVARQDQIVEQRIRPERRRLRDRQSEIGREALVLGPRNQRAEKLARDPPIGIVQIMSAQADIRQQRVDIMAETLERVGKRPHVGHRRRQRRRSHRRWRDGGLGQRFGVCGHRHGPLDQSIILKVQTEFRRSRWRRSVR